MFKKKKQNKVKRISTLFENPEQLQQNLIIESNKVFLNKNSII